MTEIYHQHGDYSLLLSGNVVIAQISGSWNREAAIAYEHSFMETVAPLIHGQWGHIVILDDWDLGASEIQPVIARLVEWCINNGLVKAAQVYSPSMVKQYYIDTMVHETLGDFERKVFTELDHAKIWLAASGFKEDTSI